MKYKLLKPLPGIKEGTILEGAPTYGYTNFDSSCVSPEYANNNPDFFEPIVEKKTYDDLKRNDRCFVVDYDGSVYESTFEVDNCRSETFLTRQEAEDEHARRELAVRKDRFIPNKNECYFYPSIEGKVEFSHNDGYSTDYMMINAGLVFETRQECQDAIDNHDLISLFYRIR